MNSANAFGFVATGLSLWVLPLLVPGWFPHTAVDGSSTRELWTQLMGLVQFGLGATFLLRQLGIEARAWLSALGVRRGALATADWETDGLASAGVPTGTGDPVDLPELTTAGDVPELTMVLPRQRAALWRMLEKAWETEERFAAFVMRSHGRRLVARVGFLAGHTDGPLICHRDALQAVRDLLARDLGAQQSGFELGEAA